MNSPVVLFFFLSFSFSVPSVAFSQTCFPIHLRNDHLCLGSSRQPADDPYFVPSPFGYIEFLPNRLAAVSLPPLSIPIPRIPTHRVEPPDTQTQILRLQHTYLFLPSFPRPASNHQADVF
ncbi:hypothetical protein LZ32DRAFT_385066 [Colletotrichum eremochloae]|nr:hypothetical protein LZ32DRAFT_385066 [Colletotrichum eremochloae]